MMHTKRWFFGTLLLALVLILAGCAADNPGVSDVNSLGFARNAHGYADIGVDDLAEMLPEKEFFLINVHIPYEGELPQTDAFIPYNEITDHLDLLPPPDAPIVLYCRSGSMSTDAARVLADLGYTEVMELDGGFVRWQNEGYELLDTR